MTKRLHSWNSVIPDEEIYRLTREAGMPAHRAGLRMRVEGKDIDRPRFRNYQIEYYRLAEPAYGVDEDRRRPLLINFTISDEGGLAELRKYNPAFLLGDSVDFYVWLERLHCDLTPATYVRIYKTNLRYTAEIIDLALAPTNEHPEHVNQLLAGYDLFDCVGERLDQNKIILKTGRPPRFAGIEQLMDGSLDAMVSAGCKNITQENIALHIEIAGFMHCDADTLRKAVKRFGVDWPRWKTGKTEKLKRELSWVFRVTVK
jgi:hypothetical protein